MVLQLKDHLADLPVITAGFNQDVLDSTTYRPSVSFAIVGYVMNVFYSGRHASPLRILHAHSKAIDEVAGGVIVGANFSSPTLYEAFFTDNGGYFPAQGFVVDERLFYKITF